MRHGTRNGGQCVPLTALRFCLALALLNVPTAFAQTITEYAIPTPGTKTRSICAGPDGALWFNEPYVNKIGRITTSGDITEFDVGHNVDGVAAGPDGNVWFTGAGIVGRITPAGVSTIFPVVASSSPPDGSPFPMGGRDGIAAGPDGSLWIADTSGNTIKRLTTDGSVTEFPIPTSNSSPRGITAGPDGNIWFTEEEGNKIGRITPQGVVAPLCTPDAHTLCLNNSRFAVTAGFQLSPTGPTFEATAVRLTADSGYFWFFTESNVEVVVKLLNGCFDPFNSYWVFAAGLTNVQVDLFVTDMLSNQTRHYTSPLGTAFLPIQDTGAFKTCP